MVVVLGCVGFGMFLLGVYWGYIFGQISKYEGKENE
jgi:hypothetical protein